MYHRKKTIEILKKKEINRKKYEKAKLDKKFLADGIEPLSEEEIELLRLLARERAALLEPYIPKKK